MERLRGLRVFAPATVNNLACGHGVLGLALEQIGNEVVAKESRDFEGLKIEKIYGDTDNKQSLEIDKNIAGLSAQMLLDAVDYSGPGIGLRIHNKMPYGFGLCEETANAVATVYAINELLRRPFMKRELFPFVYQAQNQLLLSNESTAIAPALLGGMMLTTDAHATEFHRLFLPAGLQVVLLCPELPANQESPSISASYAMERIIEQQANLATTIVGFARNNLDDVARSMRDTLVEPQRRDSVPYFTEIQEKAYALDALSCSFAGSGNAIYALFRNTTHAERAASALSEILRLQQIEHKVIISSINNEGSWIV